MMSKPENPYAYPNEELVQTAVRHPGMTLRDYFAGQTLASAAALPYGPSDCILRASLAYAMADAMLAERLK